MLVLLFFYSIKETVWNEMSYYTTAEKFQRIGWHLSIDEIFSDSVSGHDQQPFEPDCFGIME